MIKWKVDSISESKCESYNGRSNKWWYWWIDR